MPIQGSVSAEWKQRLRVPQRRTTAHVVHNLSALLVFLLAGISPTWLRRTSLLSTQILVVVTVVVGVGPAMVDVTGNTVTFSSNETVNVLSPLCVVLAQDELVDFFVVEV
jgi:hypothetical protein